MAAADKEPLTRRLLKAEAMQRVCDKLVELGFQLQVRASEALAAEAIAILVEEHPREACSIHSIGIGIEMGIGIGIEEHPREACSIHSEYLRPL